MEESYKLLNLRNTASRKAVKEAYYKLAKQYHPDRNVGDAEIEEKFRAIKSAYEKIDKEILRHCKLLGVSSTDDAGEITKSYYAVCAKYDSNKNDDNQAIARRLARLKESYDFLMQGADDSVPESDENDGW